MGESRKSAHNQPPTRFWAHVENQILGENKLAESDTFFWASQILSLKSALEAGKKGAVVDPREHHQHYNMVAMVVEKFLSRALPKHLDRGTGEASKREKMSTKGHIYERGGLVYEWRGSPPPLIG